MEKQFSPSELEAISGALADTSDGLTGSEIGHLLATLRMADPTPGITKWKRVYNAFVERQNVSKNRRAILEFIRRAMRPERYAKTPSRFEQLRANLNHALAFSGLAVNVSGHLHSVDRAETLSEAQRRADELRADLTTRGVHPDVLRFCRAELVANNYFHAVLEATKSIADKLRAKSGMSADGARLVDLTLCGDAPRIAINDLRTDSHRSEQTGFANLVKGLFGMFRNPAAHEAHILWPMSKEDAEDLLSAASLVHRRLDAAR
jgi:uncharacterized protein (TIGR02391 family)